MNKQNRITTISVSPVTLEQLSYLASVTNIPKKRLLAILIEKLYTIGGNYSRFFLDFDTSVTRERLTIFFGGENKLSFKRPEVEKIE